jgi:hypothetical protein
MGGKRVEEREARETTDLKNGATELTEGTDLLSKRLSNSTRARCAREGERDLAEHTSTVISVCLRVPGDPALPPAGRSGRRRVEF